ncbi:MOSC domain-containing protein [Curtobacterium sp. MCJR17_055]|uniref:MOSC domain-containing protein n=2 Tax=Curtobacterium TaxID=2034 RepID=UPI000D879F17|nr:MULTISPECIES: MOSC domain-containing protein [unclassified Curtobacterium]PYY36169.1 MOSC domain-containing protein [Curtobacterium sp. MCBD17_029]PYY54730.1 MOSC domain-containing protein [Curtobacterium sp. MCJR17_055]PYY60965.1 MOSC domain-containing protein [Curtobacterium sp. MCPF17_015]
MSVVTAVCRVDQLLRDSGTIGVTAIDKRPVPGPVRVRPLGLHADVQADRKHHGGEDQAVYVYADEDAAYFAGQLDRPIPPGLFGENLRTSGIDVTGLVIGERWRIGEVLELEATIPRTPCGTFARRMGIDKWVKRFAEEGRPGAYFRVKRSGPVAAGDTVTVLARPEHGVTIGQMFAGLSADQAAAVLASGDGLAPKVVREAQLALRRSAV